jgi:hypothetical protein
MFYNIIDLLPKVINKYKLNDGVFSVMVLKNLDIELNKKFGDKLKEHYKATSFKNGTINLKVKSSVIANEIEIYSKEIIDNINITLKDEVVKKINFRS